MGVVYVKKKCYVGLFHVGLFHARSFVPSIYCDVCFFHFNKHKNRHPLPAFISNPLRDSPPITRVTKFIQPIESRIINRIER